jgi:hypothetical protein
MGMTTTGPLEVAWRSYAGTNYFFVLNLSNQTLANQGMSVRGVNQWATATVDGENRVVPVKAGYMTDTFRPYEMHVYVM